MNDFDDLDDLFDPLRSAATDAELAAERSHVDAMARHHRRQKGHTMITSRRARVAAFVAAGVIGFGGVAAAGPGGPFASSDSDDTSTTSEVTTTTSEAPTTTSEVPTTTSEVTTTTAEVIVDDDEVITRSMVEEPVDADDPELVDDLEPEDFDTTKCFGLDPAQFDNHGEFVSAVARGDVELPEGIEQRDAAQSSCGKDDEEEADGDDEVEVEVEDSDDDTDDDTDHDSDDDDSDDDDGDDDDGDDDDGDDDRPEKSGKSDKLDKQGKQGKQGNGSKKNSDD